MICEQRRLRQADINDIIPGEFVWLVDFEDGVIDIFKVAVDSLMGTTFLGSDNKIYMVIDAYVED